MAAEPESPIRALDAVIRVADSPEQLQEAPEAFLAARGVDGEDLRVMLSAGAARMLVYRRLVHNRITHAIRDFIPRTMARRTKQGSRADVAAFMQAHAVQSHYLRDAPREFVQWVEPRWRAAPEVPSYLHDLARHELLALDVRNDPAGGEPETGHPVDLDRPLCFDGAARRVSYDFAIHRLPADPADASPEEWATPQRLPTHLLVYRDVKHEVRYLELTTYAAAVLDELLVRRATLRDGLQRACEALAEPLTDAKLATAAQLLADLAERGVMLGAAVD
jgi:hypothetical protein